MMRTGLKLAAVAGATVGGAAAANAAIAASAPRLDDWFDGEKASYFWRGFRVAYTAKGAGRPVLLVHGIHAAASSYEWRRNFEHLAEHYRVVAVDLLGFGHSDRPSIRYTAQTYVSLLLDFVRDVFADPPAIVASSLGAAIAVVAAYRAPEHVAGLALVCPTGLARLDGSASALGSAALAAFSTPIVGQTLFNVLASEASIRYYLERQVFARPEAADEALRRQMYATSHQPGARHAPAAFVGGALDVDLTEVFPRLTVPTLVVWGAEARLAPLADARAFLAANPAIRLEVAERAGLLPHDERAGWFHDVVIGFLG